MRKWLAGLLLVALACIPLWNTRSAHPGLLEDTDTAFLLKTIREVNNPWQWFSGDWPLYNHFYRPISTLAFEFDNWRYGNDAVGYGATNALLCIACVLLLFWFIRELTDSVPLSVGSGVLFAFWHFGMPIPVEWICLSIGAVALVGGIARHGKYLGRYLPAVMILWYLPTELYGMTALYQRMVAWIPGRTASVMTVFCLIALAAYARYERIGATQRPVEPTPLTPPATRSSQQSEPARHAWVWAWVSLFAVALALGSYEQAVMLPAALLGVGALFWWRGSRSRWWPHVGFWALLGGYLVLRKMILPPQTSGYQEQQLRFGLAVYLDLLRYLAPHGPGFWTLRSAIEVGPLVWLTASPWLTLGNFLSNLGSYWTAWWVRIPDAFRFAFTGLVLSFLSYMPMAWLKHFDHYEYWPMAMRSLFAVALVWAAAEAVAIAVSPPARQAPKRPTPAPGSLPHR